MHLLKSKTKPTLERRKRRKVELACTLSEFLKEKEGTDTRMETGLQNISLTGSSGFTDITSQLKRPKQAEQMEDKAQ